LQGQGLLSCFPGTNAKIFGHVISFFNVDERALSCPPFCSAKGIPGLRLLVSKQFYSIFASMAQLASSIGCWHSLQVGKWWNRMVAAM
jgi:hypothetical protein